MLDKTLALKKFFGYDTFRPMQEKVIDDALNNYDLLVIMPTGGGKSLCYQLPALLKPGLTVVVSPLISLMQDQVNTLKDNGIGATFLNSSLDFNSLRQREAAILQGKIKLLYVAPERLLSEKFADFLDKVAKNIGIWAFAIDEAHCVSEWGHDFRPEYRRLQQIRQRYPETVMLALTATATTKVQKDIIQQLSLRNPRTHVATFNRPNLYYEVVTRSKRSYQQLLEYVRTQRGSGIIYCLSRRRVEEVAARLQTDGVSALPYHAGMSDCTRELYQNRFIRDDVRIMVATIAFGMGIDKPDVRFVFHYDLPRNLENYYQEVGRGGRDGESANCILFFGKGDIGIIEYLIKQKNDPQEQLLARRRLYMMVEYAESAECRRKIQLSYFGERFTGSCNNCDNCLNPQPLEDWTIEAQKFLSCVARCQERFGINHIIDVLRGSRKQKIEQYGHHLLSTYGIGKNHSHEAWLRLGRSLLHQGLVNSTNDGYNILKLNKYSWEILRKQRSVQIPIPPKTKQQTSTVQKPRDLEAEFLYIQLQRLRKQLADSQGIAPYMIVADSTLKAIAHSKPKTLEALSKVPGFSEHKIAQYGPRFCSEITSFCAQSHLPTKLPSPTQISTLELYQQGLKIGEIAQQRNLKTNTIYQHLSELIEMNQGVEIDSLVLPHKREIIAQGISVVGDASLTAIKQHLGDKYSYGEIKLVRAWLRQKKSSAPGI